MGTLTVSNMEKDKFRFIGWDIEKSEDQIRITMKDYGHNRRFTYKYGFVEVESKESGVHYEYVHSQLGLLLELMMLLDISD